MASWIDASLLSTGWRQRFSWCALGALGALAMAPFYVWPVLFLSLGGWFYGVSRLASPRQAFWAGWWWGLGFCIAGLYWICIALTIDMARFGWMIPFALLGLNGALAVFYGAFSWLFAKLKRHHNLANWLLFALIMTACEWARGHWFTGFPWNLMGYSFGITDATAQAASLVGVYGLSLLTYLLATLPVLVWLRVPWARAAALTGALLAAGLAGWGAWRIDTAPLADSGTWVRLVQANIPQQLKWDQDHVMQSLQTHIDLSRSFGQKRADAIIWPETAFPFTLQEGSEWPVELSKILEGEQYLLMGAITQEGRAIHNSLVAITPEGVAHTLHRKHHLVPFGEYLPFRRHLPAWIGKFTAGTSDFAFGEAPDDVLPLTEKLSILPLICYEVIFPRYSFIQTRQGFLLNLTNDAWYGRSSGPYQHRDMMRFRAIEQGMPAVRVANTGISVAYDPLGRNMGQISLNEQGILDIQLPKPLKRATLYGSIGRFNL